VSELARYAIVEIALLVVAVAGIFLVRRGRLKRGPVRVISVFLMVTAVGAMVIGTLVLVMQRG